ncbi:hypothetical protein EDD85DRAFT_992753 [Armillaria nabsnona]|nr:hypothetical protein EDD85DRAFT_992753 [Armillaria nabsnona]
MTWKPRPSLTDWQLLKLVFPVVFSLTDDAQVYSVALSFSHGGEIISQLQQSDIDANKHKHRGGELVDIDIDLQRTVWATIFMVLMENIDRWMSGEENGRDSSSGVISASTSSRSTSSSSTGSSMPDDQEPVPSISKPFQSHGGRPMKSLLANAGSRVYILSDMTPKPSAEKAQDDRCQFPTQYFHQVASYATIVADVASKKSTTEAVRALRLISYRPFPPGVSDFRLTITFVHLVSVFARAHRLHPSALLTSVPLQPETHEVFLPWKPIELHQADKEDISA